MYDKYNGWSNYETQICDRWLSNDEALTNMLFEIIAETVDPLHIAKKLKDFFIDFAPDGMYGDLTRCAIDKINFREIVEVVIAEAEIEVEML